MNISQQQSILSILDRINSLDFNQLAIDAYPSESDFSKVQITKYNMAELLSLLRKMLSQLKQKLESREGLLLPVRENYNNDFGNINVESEIGTLYTYIESKQFQAIEPLLDKFIFYQIRNGFWNSELSATQTSSEDHAEKSHRLELNLTALEENLKLFESLKTEFSETIAKSNQITEEMSQEHTRIMALVANASEFLAKITELVGSATNKDTEITAILKYISEKIETVNKDIDSYKEAFNKFSVDSNLLTNELNSNILEASLKLDESKKGNEFIESRRSQIELLTGMAADGSLGSKFDQRQGKLSDGLKFWRWAVPIMTILSIAWVAVVFTFLSAKLGNEWANLGINVIKTSPAFILLGFVFAQYAKERNLQEEYAFKSAVAMTITAYSNMLSNEDKDENKSRQEMLMKSIEQVYRQPKIHSEKHEKLFSFNTKHLRESVQTLSEAVKNIKGS